MHKNISQGENIDENDQSDDIRQDSFQLMNDLHILISCLKAYCMNETTECFFDFRELMGAHGYLMVSAIPSWIQIWSPNVTLEGDAYVLYQQTTKKLVKIASMIKDGESFENELYPYMKELFQNRHPIDSSSDIESSDTLLDILKTSLLISLEQLSESLDQNEDIPHDTKWNKMYQLDISNVSKLHAVYMLANVFVQGVNTIEATENVKFALAMLSKLFLCGAILRYSDSALLHNYITAAHLEQIHELNQRLIGNLRKYIVALSEVATICEPFHYSSVLDSKNDTYLEDLFEYSKNSKLNSKQKIDSIDQYIKPLSQKLRIVAKI